MKIYLADSYGHYKYILKELNYDKSKLPVYLLQTFYDLRSLNDNDIKYIIKNCKCFLLDSGAFTFMNSGKKVMWKKYVDEYIEFINIYNINQFIELDLYTLPEIGTQRTLKIRKYIEYNTGKQTIPVFHACMGMEMYRDLCKEYDYIAIGASGLTSECRWVKNDKLLFQMVKIANSYNTKVHGLGYTRLSNINNTKIPFYSVDSSAWVGSRFNTRYDIKNGILVNSNAVRKGERLKDWKQLDLHNLKVWRKIQKLKSKEC